MVVRLWTSLFNNKWCVQRLQALVKSSNNIPDMHHAQPHNCTSSIFPVKFVLSPLPPVPVAHPSTALLQTYLLMVSSAWLAWSKCPPLHPCCHRGNQADQTTQRVMVLDFLSWSPGLYLPDQLCILKRLVFVLLNLGCRLLSLVSDLPQKLTLLSGSWSLSSKHTQAVPAPLPPFLRFTLITSLSPLFPFSFPALLMPLCYCGLLVTKATLNDNTSDKWMIAGEGCVFKSVQHDLFLLPLLWHTYTSIYLCEDTHIHPNTTQNLNLKQNVLAKCNFSNKTVLSIYIKNKIHPPSYFFF